MITGNFKTYELTIANGGHGELDLSTVVGSEYLLKVNPGVASVRMIATAPTSVEVADVSDLLLPTDFPEEFELGRGLSRLSFYNGSGGQAKVSIAVLF